MMVKTRFMLLCMTVLVVLGVARAASPASLFSMVLLGERLESGDVRAIALGGSAQLLVDSLGVTQLNPALSSGVRMVSVGATQMIAADRGKSSDYSERDVSVSFSTFRVAFPIANTFVLSLGYRGRFDPEGSFELPGTTNSGANFVSRFVRTGGLFSIPITVAADVTHYASVGLTFSLEHGFIQDRWDKEFSSSSFAPGAGIKKEEFSGTGFGAGIVLRPTARVLIGGMYESEIDYDTDVRELFTTPDLDTSYASSVKLPATVNVSLAIGLTESIWLYGSYASSDFGRFEGLALAPGLFDTDRSIAVGIEYPRGVRIRGKRFPVRAGVNYQELPYEQPVGEKVTKTLFALGTGMNIRDGKGKIDVTIQAGQMGSVGSNGIEDRLVRLYIGVSGGEVWRARGGQEY